MMSSRWTPPLLILASAACATRPPPVGGISSSGSPVPASSSAPTSSSASEAGGEAGPAPGGDSLAMSASRDAAAEASDGLEDAGARNVDAAEGMLLVPAGPFTMGADRIG